MPVHASPIKRQRQTEVRRVRNQAVLSRLRTLLKKAKAAFDLQDPKAVQHAVDQAISILDRAASKGVIHPNKASRSISRLSRKCHQLLLAKTSGGEISPPA
ncbi:MAG: 30S ribosomal protein S20 [Nitrospiria bacterium]